ncbi:hypothetical protein SAMN04488066_12113 [Halorubrum aquaticum]|uniref:Uncharacterized protein n=1 Tax=Halorubrum aquaticum TaxID=387340 RepID=A0A1I3CBN1_9EURY|nr:hypothetical protein [Halorubrum aquaticum]SFH71960.1 hypothetical protein SAMN04488066_12113 [Halorubrum aquaticum]
MAGSSSTADGAGRTDSLASTHWVGVAAAAVSALVHLVLGVGFLGDFLETGLTVSLAMGVAFLVASAGFLLGVWFVVTDRFRPTVYLLGIPFTAGQIVFWYALNSPGLPAPPGISPISAADKLAQVVLIAVLVVLYRQES